MVPCKKNQRNKKKDGKKIEDEITYVSHGITSNLANNHHITELKTI